MARGRSTSKSLTLWQVLLDNFFSFHGQDKFVLTSSLMDSYQLTWKAHPNPRPPRSLVDG